MSNPAAHSPYQYSPASASTDDAFDDHAAFADQEFFPGERISQPHASKRKARRRAVLLVLMLLGGGWALLGDPTSWPTSWHGWQWVRSAVAPSSNSGKVPGSVERITATPLPSPVQPIDPLSLSQPIIAADVAVPPLATAALPPAAPAPDAAPPAALPPPVIDPADPFQKRAVAVGLHPELSRVLLERLSAADYRNAGIAIRTALAETDESAIIVWPRESKADLALFHVRFVPGAAADCRRYVVTVSKDGWLTTALPMEKCAASADRSRRG